MAEPRERAPSSSILPARRAPLLYLGFAHLCLAVALGTLALEPQRAVGFYYHPFMVGVVHLVTLGWITCSILGSLFLIGPMALHAPLPERQGDLWAFAAIAVAISGMVAHFWLDEPMGMAWAAVLLFAALWHPSARFLAALAGARLPAENKLHFRLAFLNLLLASALGLWLAIDKAGATLPGYVLANVNAHAHVAALGWATMMVMAAGYRLLPMLLPAAPPRGALVWAGGILTQAGVVGLAVCLLLQSAWKLPFALAAAGGIGLFLSRIVWMVRNRRPAAAGRPRRDLSLGLVGQAIVYLLLGTLLGVVLAATPAGAWKLAAVPVYGGLVLLGFLSQMIVGVSLRLLPLFSWLGSRRILGSPERPPSPYSMVPRTLQATLLALWSTGVPLLLLGLAYERPGLLRAGSLALLAAVLLGAVAAWTAIRHLRAGKPPSGRIGHLPGRPAGPGDSRG